MTRHLLAPLRDLALVSLLTAAATSSAIGADTRAFVFATDFSSGSIADIHLGPPRTVAPNVATPSSDAVLRSFGGLLYVVNRFGFDNVQVLNPAAGFATVIQFSVGNGSNPHDIALVSATKAYVARYGSPDLWIVNPQTGAHTGTISLAPFADADGIPEMDRLAIRGSRLFVTLQRLDRDNFFVPTDSSQVVVIDLNSDTVVDVDAVAAGVQGILLPYQNPSTELLVDAAGWLVVGCSGGFGLLDGGVVRINPGTLAVAGAEITEATLGGDLDDVALSSAQRGFAVVSDASFATLLKSYNRSTGVVSGTVYSTPDFSIADTEVNDRGELWVCDRSPGNPGVRVFDAATGAPLTAAPLSTGLPPQDLAFDGATTLEVPSAAAAHGPSPLTLLGSFPNPAAGPSRVLFRLGEAVSAVGEVEFGVYDLAGRAIVSQSMGRLAPGEHTVTWNGRTAGGARVPSGAYVARICAGSSQVAAIVIRL